MKSKFHNTIVMLAFCALHCALSTAEAQGTAFTYQGRLNSSGSPANGNYDFTFMLFNNSSTNTGQVGATLTDLNVGVSNGLFTVVLDFGANFPGASRWLAIGVRSNGVGSYTGLAPLQELYPVPYAIFASTAGTLSGTLPASDFSGTYGNAVTLNNSANNFTGNGGNLTNVNAAKLGGFSAGQFWHLAGNAGTSPGSNFVGATDNQPLQLWANGTRAFLLDGTANAAQPNVIGGSSQNTVIGSAFGATIAGGYQNSTQGNQSTIGGGQQNIIQIAGVGTIAGGQQNTIETNAYISTIGGGMANLIQDNAQLSTICGGFTNLIQSSASFSTIAGGNQNTIETNANDSTIAGGQQNTIEYNDQNSTIGGGFENTIQSTANDSTIAGGFQNTIQSYGNSSTIAGGETNTITGDYATIGGGNQNTCSNDYATVAGGQGNISSGQSATVGGGVANISSGVDATVPGGDYNVAAGNSSFAAGRQAQALHPGAFVWTDSQNAILVSTANDQFTVRASGGVRLFSNSATNAGVQLAPNATAWTTLSDRDAKKNFQPVDTAGILEKLAAIPIEQWNYKWEKDSDMPHLGPMAQDFKGAFYPGRDDKGITTLEFDGVELAAIQGLNQKVESDDCKMEAELKAKDAKIASLEREIAELKSAGQQADADWDARFKKLEKAVAFLTTKQ